MAAGVDAKRDSFAIIQRGLVNSLVAKFESPRREPSSSHERSRSRGRRFTMLRRSHSEAATRFQFDAAQGEDASLEAVSPPTDDRRRPAWMRRTTLAGDGSAIRQKQRRESADMSYPEFMAEAAEQRLQASVNVMGNFPHRGSVATGSGGAGSVRGSFVQAPSPDRNSVFFDDEADTPEAPPSPLESTSPHGRPSLAFTTSPANRPPPVAFGGGAGGGGGEGRAEGGVSHHRRSLYESSNALAAGRRRRRTPVNGPTNPRTHKVWMRGSSAARTLAALVGEGQDRISFDDGREALARDSDSEDERPSSYSAALSPSNASTQKEGIEDASERGSEDRPRTTGSLDEASLDPREIETERLKPILRRNHRRRRGNKKDSGHRVGFTDAKMRFYDYTLGEGIPGSGGPPLGLAWDWEKHGELSMPVDELESFRGGILPDEDEIDEDEEWNDDWRLPREYFQEEGKVPTERRQELLIEAGHRRPSVDLASTYAEQLLASRSRHARSQIARIPV
uniref:Uncharacterized protein n=1 Tax=Rhizochromulina marina TaxID=1034831 RepID=A0A7S2STV1_9STRA